jgi:GcrA cell cycle regulator
MSWTDERVELLKKLWMDGHSASQIAGELGDGVTRNAVIGKVHRLKLSTRAKPTNVAPRTRTPARATPRRPQSSLGSSGGGGASSGSMGSSMGGGGMMKRRSMTTQSIGATALAMSEDLAVEMYMPAATVTELFVPENQRLSLLDLTEKTCKWPIGDPLTPDFYFCGQHSGEATPYCEFHAKRAYHQADRKKR